MINSSPSRKETVVNTLGNTQATAILQNRTVTSTDGSGGSGGYGTRERERILVSNRVRTTEFITRMGDDIRPLQETEFRLAA